MDGVEIYKNDIHLLEKLFSYKVEIADYSKFEKRLKSTS